MIRLASSAIGIVACLATPALADPCTAIPDRGPPPGWMRPMLQPGATFAGPVTYVGDGDMICVGKGPEPSAWIEVRLSDFYAPELNAPGGRAAYRVLQSITAGKFATCTTQRGNSGRTTSFDRVVAVCSIDGVALGTLMRRAGVVEGGNGRSRR
jgi:micrococcal nuclease